MNRIITCLLFLACLTGASGCASFNVFKTKISIDGVIAEKEVIDQTDNPAKQYTLLEALKNKKVVMENIIVKDIIDSSHIDYSFCIVADVLSNDKKVECYIYCHNVKVISRLVKNESAIDVKGTFERFFSTLDGYYTKVEITSASVKIRGSK